MHELLNIKTNQKISFPSQIDEMSPDQYLAFLKLVTSNDIERTDIFRIKQQLFKIVCPIGFSISYIFRRNATKKAIRINIAQLVNLMDSFFDIVEVDNKMIYNPILKSGYNLLKSWENWKGPDDMLNDITWGQFVSCMNLINENSDAFENKIESDINQVITSIFQILYIPQGNCDINNVPIYIRFHAFNFFSYVFELISTYPIPISGEDIDFRILFIPQKNSKKDDKTGWAGLGFSIAESGVFGKTTEVNNQNFWDVLIYLYKCTFEIQNNK